MSPIINPSIVTFVKIQEALPSFFFFPAITFAFDLVLLMDVHICPRCRKIRRLDELVAIVLLVLVFPFYSRV